RIAINGFGRIGRQVMRLSWERDDLEVRRVNDLVDAETLAYLLRYDTSHGTWDRRVEADDGALIIDGRRVPVSGEKDPANLPWKDDSIDVVIEATGIFRTREKAEAHLEAGAKKVLITAPGKSALDGDFVIGVNEDLYDPARHHVISVGSCTTNCLAPMAKALHDELTIIDGLMTTTHAYTASQNLLDGPHKKLERTRAAAENIIATTTGAAEAIGAIIPDLDGRLDGMALRVPAKCGSITDLTCRVETETSVEAVNELMEKRADGRMRGVLRIADAPLVSSDIVGDPHSCIFLPDQTRIMGGTLVKVLGWYDNEWGFSNRVVEMAAKMV
ncbi:MAG: type I glyceraldehyde-3-phosphate dehydrogenase, partial [Planctomycetota bacterium]|nr:type I glyceraldehyde-3-phosphate dehydrogenase [Planctomycetota bacterium]